MNGYIAPTDYEWYSYLSGKADLEEANFWKPSGNQTFKVLQRGEPLIFKLKANHGHAIVGFGLFALFKQLTVYDAWHLFGDANGAPDMERVVQRVGRYAQSADGGRPGRHHVIGCVLLASPIFFDRPLWVRGPADWKDQIVSGKTYDLTHGEGRRIWNECMERAAMMPLPSVASDNLGRIHESARHGEGYLVHPRLGQGLFRASVQDAYNRCAVSGEHSLPALDAAHIKPFKEGGPNELPNGLLLRADIHRLFDRGYVTITPDYRFQVSPALNDEFHNGKIYYQKDGSPIWLPPATDARPSKEYLAYHGEHVFLK